ncbi:hypothetical protein FN846DRAFT_282441 [Sphaerosporella brunnea]|uniref:ABC transporter domain-containing protein n=1 Tax=Sphaerosporella brunnea TaxID=1250544 RepID=A0A5J5EN92_9PEZI|nr:hypothetical protein FN846DRAFT_282441 [Sphaerosporella brunnea]
MGPSGSGKSSLLNLMARRLHSSLTTRYSASGKMLFNGANPSNDVIRSLCSETLRYAAALRLPSWMSAAEKERRAEDIILKLGLRECADVPIGSEFM